MDFLFSELHGWGKRFAARPKTIYSEVPLFYIRKEHIPALAIVPGGYHFISVLPGLGNQNLIFHLGIMP